MHGLVCYFDSSRLVPRCLVSLMMIPKGDSEGSDQCQDTTGTTHPRVDFVGGSILLLLQGGNRGR